jgi:hypothetical protein
MMEVCAPYTDHDDEIGFSEPFVPLFLEQTDLPTTSASSFQSELFLRVVVLRNETR